MILGLVFIAYASLFVFGLVDNTRGPFYPLLLKHFSMSSVEGSWFWALSCLVGLGINFSAPRWLSLKSGHFWLRAGLLCLVLGPLSLSLAYSTKSLIALWSSTLFFGAGIAMTNQMVNLFIVNACSADYRRRVLGGVHGIYGLAALSAPLLLNTWFKYAPDKTYDYFFLAITIVVLLVLFISFRIKNPIEFQSFKADSRIPAVTWARWALLLGLYIALEIMISSRLVLFLNVEKGMSLEAANQSLIMFFLFLMIGRFFITFFRMPIRGRQLLLISILTTLVFLCIGVYHNSFFLSLTGLSLSFFFPTTMDILAEEFPENTEQIIPLALSGVDVFLIVMHLGFGQAVDKLGLEQAMHLVIIICVLVFISLLILPSDQSKSSKTKRVCP